MPIDAQARKFLDEQAALETPPLHELTPETARANMRAGRHGLVSTGTVAWVRDLSAAGPAGPVPLRAYGPEGSGPHGIVMYFHGGGWVLGDLDTHDAICRSLAAASNCVVVSVHYRLAPEHPYPAAADDAYAATCWVAEHAASLGGDATRMAVAGDSAGGNLATTTALQARDRQGPPLKFQLLVYPVADHDFETKSYLENAEGYQLTRNAMVWFWDLYVPRISDRDQAYASPLRASDLSRLPPALVQTAEFDPLRDEGEALAARLQDAGVPTKLTRYDGTIHGFFRHTVTFNQGTRALEEAAASLRAALGGG